MRRRYASGIKPPLKIVCIQQTAAYKRHPMDTPSIIERLGGPAKTAEICGVSRAAVSLWRRVGIPPSRWQIIVTYARTNEIPGITFDSIQAARHSAQAVA
jgi:hypothetical protein